MEDFYNVETTALGEGSFGTVHLAKCKSTGVERALKAIELKSVKNPVRFEREINIAKQLDHPNVVRLYETFRDAKKIYLIMELCTGRELFDRIVDEAPKGFDEYKAAKYIRQILAALCYLHAQSFAHRDVKPENFLLQNKTPDAALKIIDFGLACQFTADTQMSTKAGTAYYVAPEVLKGGYDEKCDIWSAGVISFILLCGYPPFSGDTDPEILKKVKNGSFEFKSPEWDNISQGAKNLVTQMLTSDPTLRPSAEHLLQSQWLKYKGAPKQEPLQQNFMKRLQSFQASSRLKKIALTAVAQQLPDKDIENLQNIFKSLDKNGDGLLSAEEIKEGMQNSGIQVPKALEDILKSVDLDGSGQLDYTEFLAATLEKKTYMKRDILWRAFRIFDLDGDGKITREELSQVLNGNDVKNVIGAAKIDKMFQEVDANGDGAIDFEEFMVMMEPGEKGSKRRRTT
jgi:calcium-dependent protein kinase